LRDAPEQASGWYGTATDIEDYKQVEEALRRSGRLQIQAQAAAHVGSFVADIIDPADRSRDRREWSAELYRIYGFEPGEVEPSEALVRSRLHPEDRDRAVAIVEQAFRDLKPFELEYRYRRP